MAFFIVLLLHSRIYIVVGSVAAEEEHTISEATTTISGQGKWTLFHFINVDLSHTAGITNCKITSQDC